LFVATNPVFRRAHYEAKIQPGSGDQELVTVVVTSKKNSSLEHTATTCDERHHPDKNVLPRITEQKRCAGIVRKFTFKNNAS